MKPLRWCLLILALAGAGCTDRSLLRPEQHPQPKAAPVAPPPVRALPPVTAEQVNPNNAHAKTEELREELDRAQLTCPAGCDSPGCTCGHH